MSMIKERIKENAINYLKEKQKKKGSKIEYKNLEMAEYLQPNCEIDNREKEKLFEMRNEMTSNYGGENECICGKIETMVHIYSC